LRNGRARTTRSCSGLRLTSKQRAAGVTLTRA
jgi:hypothetical protein